MEFLKKLLPNYTPPNIAAQGNLAVLRERILQSFFIGLFFLGVPAVGVSAFNSFHKGLLGLGFLYIIIFIWLASVLILRNLPYSLRAGTVMLLTFAISISELWDSGLLGEVRFWLLALIIIAAIFSNLWTGLVVTVFSSLSIIFVGISLEANLFTIPNKDAFFSGTSYSTSSIIILMVGIALSITISMLLSGLVRALKDHEVMTENLRQERVELENRIQDRTTDIQRRLVQVRTAADISRAISQITDPDIIFQQVVKLIQDRMGLYYAGIFTLDENNRNALLRAGTGEAGRAMLAQRHALLVGGSSMIGWSIANRQPRIALDTGEEAVRFNNPFLPLTRSELALPILSRDVVLGALSVQSEKPQAFDQDDIIVLQSIADSLAIALENSRLYNELENNLEEVRTLNRNYLRQAWTDVLSDSGDVSVSFEGSDLTHRTPDPSILSLPILLREQVIGQLTLESTEEQLSEEDLAFIDALTTQTALALENARLVQETERRAIQEQKLNAFSNRFSRTIDIDSILKAAVEEFGQLPAVTEASIQLLPASAYDQPAHSLDGKERAG